MSKLFSSLAVNTEDQAVMVEREVENGISYLKTGTAEQAGFVIAKGMMSVLTGVISIWRHKWKRRR